MNKKEFVKRRKVLMDHIEPNSIAIIPSAHEVIRSRDVHYPFRQDNDFYYLTGFNEPDAVLVLLPGRTHGEQVLFCRSKDPQMETWHGRRAGQIGALQDYAMDDSFPYDDIDDILPGLIEGTDRVYYAMGVNHHFDEQVMNWVNQLRASINKGAHPPGEFIDIRHTLNEMRLIKSAAEIKLMQAAAEASAQAHIKLMQKTAAGVSEATLEHEFNYQIGMRGCRYPAYPSIVAGGENACILHYVDNSDKLKKGQLLLVDAGGEYQYYAADITRTYPVSGKFSKAQRALYDIVLTAQLKAIETVKPGNPWNVFHDTAVEVLTQGLIDLDIIQGPLDVALSEQRYKPFYMHKTGHWIGLDVHDVGDYQIDDKPRILEPGMVLTVEPGLYISEDADVDPKWRGIGIRIEDDILVTKDGNRILTKDVPKSVHDIELLMKQAAEDRNNT
jgi:Xaa-Pro aminopeptidase